MSIRCVSASSQGLINAATPITGYPWSAGFWMNSQDITSVTYYNFTILEQTGDHGFYFRQQNADLDFLAYAGGLFPAATVTSALTLNTWAYVLLRAISATSRRISVLTATGAPLHAQNTTSIAPNPATHMSIGYGADGTINSPSDMMLAEFFIANADIVGTDIETPSNLVHQLAYRGPFSVPRIKKDVIEYRSFRSRTILNDTAEVYWRPGTPQPRWTATNAPLGGYPQPPHSAGYVTPWGGDRLLPVYELDTIVPPAASDESLGSLVFSLKRPLVFPLVTAGGSRLGR